MTVQDEPDYAPGTQKNVSGEVIRWNNVSGPERIDAKKYIELLETEIEELNSQVGRKSANGQNELLEYLKSLEPLNLKVNTVTAFLCILAWCLGQLMQLTVTVRFLLGEMHCTQAS
jgi:hypothetical protein